MNSTNGSASSGRTDSKYSRSVSSTLAAIFSGIPTRRAISRELDAFFLRFPRAVVGVDRTLKVVFANPRARNILGRDLIRIGRPFVDGAAEGRLRALAERLTTIAAPIPASLVELRDGRRLRVTGVAASGREPAVMLIDDVTEEVRRDEVTRDFLRNAAHQLRTPLTGIATAVQVLQSGAKDDADDRDRFLAHIERHTARLSRIAIGTTFAHTHFMASLMVSARIPPSFIWRMSIAARRRL